MMSILKLPEWTPPLIALVILVFIYPQVTQLDQQRKVTVASNQMQSDITIENQTDAKANEVALLETKMNELLANTGGTITLSRTGNVHYAHKDNGELYEADFFITALHYFVIENSIKGECRHNDCVTITKKGFFTDSQKNTDIVFILLQSAEQGDRLIHYLEQFEQISNNDATIQKDWERRLKRLVDKFI